MSGGVRKKFHMTDLTMPNNLSFMKYPLKSVPGLADVGVLHGDDLITPPRCLEGVRKKFQMTFLTVPNNISSINCALKSAPGLAHVGVLHGDGDGPRAPPRCPGGPEKISND